MSDREVRSLDDALAFIASYIEAAIPPMRVSVSAAYDHLLAEDIVASVSLPRFDNAAMDGFAIRTDDVRPDGTACLKITQTITAGQEALSALCAGEAARITTGAPVPPGADRVVVQEAARLDGDQVHLRAPAGGKLHIRKKGEDVAQGTVVMVAGTRIGPGQIALLSSLGLRSVLVAARPKVALLSTGDELVDNPGLLEPGKIFDTNRPMLLRMLQAAGAAVTDLGIARDDPELILERLVAAAADHDLLVSTGGASAGFADHLTRIIVRRGYLEFWKLDMRPGKPVGFGDIDDCPILLLPGNPLAAAASFALLGRAIIARLGGKGSNERHAWHLPVTSKIAKPPGRTQVLLGRLRQGLLGRATAVEPLPDQGSARLRYLAVADVMIVLHSEQTEILEGDVVEVLPF
ncbi:molybdopterin molybdotransferase [Shinella sp. BE166]|uniref:molybdopterin molybdotransferase MoeA n=1 Tax=Shinella sp. BE166 TaxID=3373918 RepID=UPI003EB84929